MLERKWGASQNVVINIVAQMSPELNRYWTQIIILRVQSSEQHFINTRTAVSDIDLGNAGTAMFCQIQMFFHLCHFDTTQTSNIHPNLRRRPPWGGKQSLWRILFHQIHQFCFPSAFNSSHHGSLGLQRQERSIFSVELHSALATAAL